ncbi:unnamed protein product [Cochlearia groenlandica]
MLGFGSPPLYSLALSSCVSLRLPLPLFAPDLSLSLNHRINDGAKSFIVSSYSFVGVITGHRRREEAFGGAEKRGCSVHKVSGLREASLAFASASEGETTTDLAQDAENVCNLKKEEVDWILKIDIVEKGQKLELLEQEEEGMCNSKCKTIEAACQNGLPGAPGMKVYSRDDIEKYKKNPESMGNEDDDEDEDEDEKFPKNLGKVLKEEKSKNGEETCTESVEPCPKMVERTQIFFFKES